MKVGVALGSNLGNRLKHLQEARKFLIGLSKDRKYAVSPIYETEPVGCPPNSPQFLNAVMEIEFEGEPRTLLNEMLGYELGHGRNRELPKNAARTIDLDILYFGDREIHEPDLIVPHPRMAERRFVLLPLSAIHPDLILKGADKTVRALVEELPTGKEEVKLVQQDW